MTEDIYTSDFQVFFLGLGMEGKARLDMVNHS